MRYISTRGASPPIGFVDAVLAGLAPDGGLYVPEVYPRLAPAEIADLAGRPYAEVATRILQAFCGEEIDEPQMAELCQSAYASFRHPAVAPLVQLSADTFLLELFHGPTLAFKDVAMQLLGRLYDHVLGLQGRKMTVICATSGDTGGAAVEAFRGRRHVRIVALFPEGRISAVQRRFMTTANDDNVCCVAIDGTFDDCQAIVKASFQDKSFRQAVDLSGVNSINWARIAAQSAYYFTAALALGAPERSVAFAVPTGNFGDAFAGYVAHRMGLPVAQVLVATNSNDILARAFSKGDYALGAVTATHSPAMDIQVASNFERLYFELGDRNAADTARAFGGLAQSGSITLPPETLTRLQALFRGVAVSEADTLAMMATIHIRTGMVVDPHTAVALAGAARQERPGEPPMVIFSTAHAAKFPEAVVAALGAFPVATDRTTELQSLPEHSHRLPADVETVKAFVRAFAER